MKGAAPPASVVQLRAIRAFGPALLALTCLLQGCAIGPDYQRPQALGTNALPSAFSLSAAPTNGVVWKPAEPAAHRPRGAWWELFQDPDLIA